MSVTKCLSRKGEDLFQKPFKTKRMQSDQHCSPILSLVVANLFIVIPSSKQQKAKNYTHIIILQQSNLMCKEIYSLIFQKQNLGVECKLQELHSLLCGLFRRFSEWIKYTPYKIINWSILYLIYASQNHMLFHKSTSSLVIFFIILHNLEDKTLIRILANKAAG